LPVVIDVALLVYCLIDCIQTPPCQVRNLSKTVWLLLIIFIAFAGPIAWLVAGRPSRTPLWQPSAEPAGGRYTGRRAPDDDPEFLASIQASDERHEQMLAEWEAQLRERESRLRDHDSDDDSSR